MKASLDRCSIRRVTPPRHVIVCGAGVVGASVAYFLARRGVAVTVVERTGVACAASGKSGGFLALDWCDGSPLGPLARASFTLHAELAAELSTDYGYRRMETFMLAARERGTPAGGHRVAAPPWLDGSGIVTAALGSQQTTAQVTPARFTAALLDAARARGARLHVGVVEDVAWRGAAASGVLTAGGETLEGDAVVLAMGPWTGRLAGRLRLPSVYGLKGYSVTLDAPDVPAHALFVDYRTADGRALEPEIFPRPDGEVYVCGMADPAPLPDSPEAVEVNESSCETLARAAGRVSAALAGARVVRRQACYRPVTDDGVPLIGRVPGVRGVFVATGHGPWGILNAPATGLAMAELVADGAAKLVDLRPFDPARLPAARRG
ncbi:MAG: FAD-binding oxidoreductase [Candidatus Rokuibacteriota bacterium]|nr:MAG: FAD-binding oxidoreductase [Candidatus Rokubacteria bacterium]